MENFLYFYIYFVFVGTLIVNSNGNIPTEKLCADLFCQKKISHGRTLSSHDQNNKDAGSFKKGDEGDVYARVGNLYEVEIKGQRVMVPGNFFIEDKIYIKNEALVSVPNVSGVTDYLKNLHGYNAGKDDVQTQLHKTEQESQKSFEDVKKPESNVEAEPEKDSSKSLEGSSIQEQNNTSKEEINSQFNSTDKSDTLPKAEDVHAEENSTTSVDDKIPEKEQLKSSVVSAENENVKNTIPLPPVTGNKIVTSNLENETITEKPNVSPVQPPGNSEVVDGTVLPKEDDSDDGVTVEDDNEEDEEEEDDEDDLEEFVDDILVDENGNPILNETIKNTLTLEANVPGNSLIETQNPNSSNPTLSENIYKADNLDTKVSFENNTKTDDAVIKKAESPDEKAESVDEKAESADEKAENLGNKSENETNVDVDNKTFLKEDIDKKNENKNIHLDESSSESPGMVINAPETTTPTYESESPQNPLLETTTQSNIHSHVTLPPNSAEKTESVEGNLQENQISEGQINKFEDNSTVKDNEQKLPYQGESYGTEQTENKGQFSVNEANIPQESVNKKPEINNDVAQENIGLEPASERDSQKDAFTSRELNNPYDKPPPLRKSSEDGSFAYDPYQTVHQTQDSNVFKSQSESVENIPISEPNAEQSSKSFIHDKFPVSENPPGLFSTMLETVKKVWYTTTKHEYNSNEKLDSELERILYPNQRPKQEANFCEKLSPENCPSSKRSQISEFHPHCASEKDFFTSLNDKILETVDLLVFLGVVALTVLIFAFGYYCISHGKKENALLSKLNIVERSLLASNKEGFILKHELMETRNKLTSIENNSFGSNDMVLALKKELEASEQANLKLKDQVAALEAELENAAEAGLELNKIVSDLLSSQGGDDSIISSVEELQKQLNEQQNTIVQINTTLAEKSRENSELQLVIAAQTAKFSEEIQNLKRLNKELEEEKNASEAKHIESKQLLEEQMSRALEEKTSEVATLRNEISILKTKYEETSRKWQKSDARLQALEECLTEVKKNPKVNIKDLMDVVNMKTEMLATSRERDSLKERLEGEMDARKLLEDHVKIVSEEVSALKQEYTQSEKDKLEAQTRLEVLSSYFKEKETQLQKELSVKEAMWMKQQGETTSTVERVRTMQDELQGLKSQNDSLRAEIEAQAAAHKAQIASLENRAHENWLAARQTERKLEESRSEATALRRKLTSLAGNPVTNDANMQNRAPNVDGLSNDLNNASSPLQMESPSSPLLGGLPPPAFLPPPPFMAPPHPFMPMPPPFIPPGEMRPPPLGRLMSPPPPPPHDRYSPSIIDERDRYSPENGRYSPDSRYNYNTDIMSTYDTETDFSPPPSPQTRSAGGSGGGYNNRDRERNRIYKPFSPPPSTNADRSRKTKGILSSGSADSYDSRKSKGKGKV